MNPYETPVFEGYEGNRSNVLNRVVMGICLTPVVLTLWPAVVVWLSMKEAGREEKIFRREWVVLGAQVGLGVWGGLWWGLFLTHVFGWLLS